MRDRFPPWAVGAALLRSWGLPDTVVDAVGFHHQPGQGKNCPLAMIVSLADAAAARLARLAAEGRVSPT